MGSPLTHQQQERDSSLWNPEKRRQLFIPFTQKIFEYERVAWVGAQPQQTRGICGKPPAKTGTDLGARV